MKFTMIRRITALGLILVLAAGIPIQASSASTEKVTEDAASTKSLQEAQDEKAQLEKALKEAQSTIEDLRDSKGDIESKVTELNQQLIDISARITDLENQLTAKSEDIQETKDELAGAKEREAQQYADMKVRIQFMYENGSTPVWQMLAEAESFSDFLNRTEYITDINAYDRKKLVEYQDLQEQIAAQKEDLESDMTELVAMQDDMKKKQANVSSLINTTKANLAQTQEDLADAQSNVADLEDKINQMVEYEKQLEIQKAKEDAARLAAIKEQEKEDTSTVVYVPTDSDQYLLGAIIQCEAGGESYDGKLAVGSVVINRVKSSYFPNSVSGVIYQSGQFSPVASGRLAYRLEAGVDGSCLQAAQDVLNGNITVGCLYFRQNNGIIQGTVIGNHVFY